MTDQMRLQTQAAEIRFLHRASFVQILHGQLKSLGEKKLYFQLHEVISSVSSSVASPDRVLGNERPSEINLQEVKVP